MEKVLKFMSGELLIRICLWGMFVAGVAFTILNGISAFGVMSIVGALLMAIDYPKKKKQNK